MLRATSWLWSLALGLAGCVVPNPPLALHRPEVAAAPPELALIRLEDARPAVQRVGQVPSLLPLVVWNSRIGDYVTGDDAFADDVGAAVSRALAEALSDQLGPARMFAAGTEPDAACTAAGARYVAHGTIHHMYATRRQHSFVFVPVFAAMWSFDPGEPVGIVSLDLEVSECETGETLLAERFREHKRLRPERTLSEAARSALRGLAREVRRTSLRLRGRLEPAADQEAAGGRPR